MQCPECFGEAHKTNIKDSDRADSYIARVRQTRRMYLSIFAIISPILFLLLIAGALAAIPSLVLAVSIIGSIVIFMILAVYATDLAFPLSPPDPSEWRGCQCYRGWDGNYRCIWCGTLDGLDEIGDTCTTRLRSKQNAPKKVFFR